MEINRLNSRKQEGIERITSLWMIQEHSKETKGGLIMATLPFPVGGNCYAR